MDLFARYQDEQHPAYQTVQAENHVRYSSFLISMIESAVRSDQLKISEDLIKAINFHAIVALYPDAGQYRSEPVYVGSHYPPPSHEVAPLMREMVETINQHWDDWPSVELAAYALWRINYIHPFINGNGRAARAACYFIICVKIGAALPGTPILPELLRQGPTRTEYVLALQMADDGNLRPLTDLVERLITQQLQ